MLFHTTKQICSTHILTTTTSAYRPFMVYFQFGEYPVIFPDHTHSLVHIHDLLNGLLLVEEPPQSPVEELTRSPPLKDVLCREGRSHTTVPTRALGY